MTMTDRDLPADASLDAIEARSERLREGLADTVGELRHRLAPGTIKAEVKDQLTQTGNDMLAKLKRTARENPLQTAAIGAGLAYPVIGILRSIPAPILLMGAGVALSGRNNIFAGLMPADRMSEAFAQGSDKAADLASMASDKASSAASAISERVQSLTGQVGDAATSATTQVSDAFSTVKQTVSDTLDSATSSARMAVHDATDTVGDAADRAAALGRQGRDTLIDTVQRNPLLVGALTALAGAALAALIPASRTEARLFGETSSRLKEQVKSTAYEGMQAAMDAGGRVIGSTMDAASEEGLDVHSGREAIHDIADRAGAVVDAAVAAVVPENESDAPSSDRPLDS